MGLALQQLAVFLIVAAAVVFLLRRVLLVRRRRRGTQSFVPLSSLKKRKDGGCH